MATLVKPETGEVVEPRALSPYEPQNIEQAFRLAQMLAKSGIIPKQYKGKPEDILVSIMTGRELGFAPMQSLRGIHVVNGLVIMSADAIIAKALQHPDCEYFRLVDSNKDGATYETRRRGSDPVKLSWTKEDATTAGLLGKDNWQKHPRAMYRARCAAALARAVYPDAMFGVYEHGEGEEIRPDFRKVEPEKQQPETDADGPEMTGEEEFDPDAPMTKSQREQLRAFSGLAGIKESEQDWIDCALEKGTDKKGRVITQERASDAIKSFRERGL